MQIDEDFSLGAATAAYQIEGAVAEGGRGPSIWDVFSHTEGRTHNGDTGDLACDHYHRYQEDVAMMANLGLDAYRFSIAWPRLFPDGKGSVNQSGLDFYHRLTECLLEVGIQPVATLYHWDLPLALQQHGGWTNRDTAERFADYADAVFRYFGDVIPRFITLNEPWCSAVLGHLYGEHAPGLQDVGAAVAATHHLLLAHGRAVEAFAASRAPQSQIGITNILTHLQPSTDTPVNAAALARVDDVLNRVFLDPLFQKGYPPTLQAMGVDALIQPGDLETICQPIDFLGVNYYRTMVVTDDPDDKLLGATLTESGDVRTAMGWGVDASGLYAVLMRVHQQYGRMPIFITENGAAFDDKVEDGQIHDEARIAYLRQHLEQILRAKADGVDVRGYFVWSLLDNFEWSFGYEKRFGIIHVDYETQARCWKDSAKWYQQVIQNRTI